MDNTTSNNTNVEKHLTNTKWIMWYHNPSDKNWKLDSYKDIIEISSLEDFCVLKNTWSRCLPNTSEGMFFLMRKTETGCIYPQWEDKHNKNGGYWSFKVAKSEADNAWFNLIMYAIGENITSDINHSLGINGISVSPKKHFCIFKIWNNDNTINNKQYLSTTLDFLNMSEVLYSNHNDNIQKDKLKVNKRYRQQNDNRRNHRSNDNRRRHNDSNSWY